MTRNRSRRAPLWAPMALVSMLALHHASAEEKDAAQAAAPSPAEATESAPAPAAAPKAEAPPSATPTTSPSEDYKATKIIPRRLLRALLGCWQLDEQERWTISRIDTSGAQVATAPLKSTKKRSERIPFPNQAKRAAVPATLMYDAKQDNFGFSTAGKGNASLVVFKLSGPILEASLFSKRSRRQPYVFAGYSATLDRCKAPARKRAKTARPAAVPPRLK